MKCFLFSNGDKNDEPKTTKSITKSILVRSTSSSTDREIRKFVSEFNSHNASDVSIESSARISFTCLSQRSSNLRVFTVDELKVATKNFSRSLMIGEGGFGGVYRGVIRDTEDPDKKIDVAVKQLSSRGLQGHKEWVTEVDILGVLDHPNLVKLVGYCAEDNERGMQRLLIYEYMPNRSVQDHLSSRFQTPLPWITRLKIAQDAACGLAYLHEGMDFQIIFRDFKSSNILLDDRWHAKLSDFGLARLGPSDGVSHVSTVVVGTVGYAAPEYVQTGRLTAKSDVWSYGVFLYELITGRRPLDQSRPKNEQKLLDWVRPHLSDTIKFEAILDPRLKGRYPLKAAQKLVAVANRCLVRNPKTRPKMSDVLRMVSRIVEAIELGSPEAPINSPLRKSNASPFREGLKRRLVEPLIGEKRWVVAWQTWRAKVVSTS
ncbi:Non-specific serine/threonine protein kinase [Bertholletia excelsa]